MTTAEQVFAGSIPAIYERCLGPLLFAPYAEDLARGLKNLRRGRILETAAGTGILTRALARALPDGVAILATDLSQAMLDYAATLPIARKVDWRQADAMGLPFPDGCFDAVVAQFGMMFLPDKRVGFAEARRVLKPGAPFLFSVWNRIEENELSRVVHEAVAAAFPDDPPDFLARAPHGYNDGDRIRDTLRQAGFAEVVAETVDLPGRAAAARDVALGFCQGSPLRGEIEGRAPNRLAEVTEAATRAVAARFGPGPIQGRMSAHVFTATA